MANVQIYQLDNAGSDLDNSALLACDITNPDASERATTPKVTRKLSVAELESQVLNDEEYTTELNTTNQTIFGAINELHSSIGADAYDSTATYNKGDYCIYNNTLYKCTTAITTAEAWDASHWTATSIADEINELNTGKQDTLVFHHANSSNPVSLNGTYQIPQNILDHNFVLVGARRAGLGNYTIFKTSELLQYDNGFTLLATGGGYITLTCSSTGLLKVTNLVNMNDPYIFASGIL